MLPRPISAVLTPVGLHAFDVPHMALSASLDVQVHDMSADGVGVRSRVPLDVCGQYQLRCQPARAELDGAVLRVVSIHRGGDGVYRIGTAICRQEQMRLAA